MTVRHILVATDFSPPAERALDLGIELAQKLDAKILLVHALVMPQVDYGMVAYYPAAELELGAQKALDQAVIAAKKKFGPITGLLVQGEASSQLLAVAEDNQIDLILIGTHGRNWLTRVLLGSVADKVVRTSPIPVLTVPAPLSPNS